MNPFFNPNDIQKYIEQIKEPLMKGFPYNGNDIQNQVMQNFDQLFPNFMRGAGASEGQPTGNQSGGSEPQVFETHDFVIARIPTQLDTNMQPRILMDTYHLFIKGLPERSEQLTLKLPSPIKPKSAKAEYKDGVLEIRLLKRGPEPMTEINVD